MVDGIYASCLWSCGPCIPVSLRSEVARVGIERLWTVNGILGFPRAELINTEAVGGPFLGNNR